MKGSINILDNVLENHLTKALLIELYLFIYFAEWTIQPGNFLHSSHTGGSHIWAHFKCKLYSEDNDQKWLCKLSRQFSILLDNDQVTWCVLNVLREHKEKPFHLTFGARPPPGDERHSLKNRMRRLERGKHVWPLEAGRSEFEQFYSKPGNQPVFSAATRL